MLLTGSNLGACYGAKLSLPLPRWQILSGIGGRNKTEHTAAINRTGWQEWSGKCARKLLVVLTITTEVLLNIEQHSLSCQGLDRFLNKAKILAPFMLDAGSHQ